MNTKRLFFGLLAVAFLAMTAVSTTIVEEDQTVSIEKKKIRKL